MYSFADKGRGSLYLTVSTKIQKDLQKDSQLRHTALGIYGQEQKVTAINDATRYLEWLLKCQSLQKMSTA